MSDPPPEPPEIIIDVVAPPASTSTLPTVQVDNEPTIHGLVGTYFGDLEVDQGKSVSWFDHFTDDLFITDVNTGEQRYWVVDWSSIFPDSEHTVTGRNFFLDAANWRREQFEYGDKVFHYDDDDWCLFIDGSDGLSFDTRTLPTDYNALPFMSWVYREVERAVAAGRDHATFPLFIYLHDSDLQTITYGLNTTPDAVELGIPAAKKPLAVPWYLPYQGLTRLWKVSALRNPSFDWTRLDTPVAASPNVEAQIVSYAYAHWQPLDIPPGQTEVPPLSEATDHGWKMRNLISKLRPISGIPFQSSATPEPGYLTPTVGTVSTPDPGPFPEECTLVFKVRPGTLTYGEVVGQWGGPYSWTVMVQPNGFLQGGISTDGTGGDAVYPTSPFYDHSPVNDEVFAVGLRNQGTDWRFGRLAGGAWQQSPWGTHQLPFNSVLPLRIGNVQMNGRIYSVELRTGLDPAAGTVLWRFSADDYPGYDTSYVDPRGRTWTLTNPAAITLNWKTPSADPDGVPGPWGVDVVSKVDPAIATTVEEDGHTPPESITAGVLTPLYTSVVRLNLREDLWYEQGIYGNIPLFWDDVNQKWTPVYRPDQWPIYGLGSKHEPSPPLSPMSLRLGGAAGDHVLTQPPQDATQGNLAFDLQFSLSVVICAALDQWFDGEQKLVSQDQAWSWIIDTDGGMTFSRSRDGTAFDDFTIPAEEVPAWADEETVVLGVSYVTATDPDPTVAPKDEVRFWIWDGEVWEQLGDTQSVPNPDDNPIFDSPSPIQVGGGTAGLFRVVSIRQNVGDEGGIGTGEMARMRGDLTSNPSNDRYGNTWTNHGTWSYEEMQDMPTLPLP